MPPKSAPKRARLVAALPEPQSPAAPTLPEAAGAWKAVALLLAFWQPAAGSVLALIYWKAPSPPSQRFARWCLVLALLGWLVAGGSEAVHAGLQSGEWSIQPY